MPQHLLPMLLFIEPSHVNMDEQTSENATKVSGMWDAHYA